MNGYNSKIGEKIKSLRLEAGISQFEMESNLSISAGSLSKIESGKVIPSRETILKIINILQLNFNDASIILELSLNKFANIIDLISNINLLRSVKEIAQMAVNEIPKNLNLLGASVNFIRDNKLVSGAITNDWYTDLVLNMLPFNLSSFEIPLKSSQNLMVESISTNQEICGNNLAPFVSPKISPALAKTLQYISGVKSILCMPLKVEDRDIGVVLYVKNKTVSFRDELPMLRSLSFILATILDKAIND